MGHTNNLIWAPDEYSKSNNAQQRDADQLIDQIFNDGVKQAEIIVDIGCGPGNVTEKLSQRIPHKMIYASDFDPQMISYAIKNHDDGSIEYFVQDIGLPWEKLDERLKALEGKVDLVWSNRVLHWVKDKATAAKTIARLLKPGGRCYINTTLMRDPFEFDDEKVRRAHENFYQMESPEQQHETLKSVFGNSGLSHVKVELIEKEWTYGSQEQYDQMTSSADPFWRMLMLPSALKEFPQEEIDTMVNTMREKCLHYTKFPFGINPYTTSESTDKLHIYYEQFRTIGVK